MLRVRTSRDLRIYRVFRVRSSQFTRQCIHANHLVRRIMAVSLRVRSNRSRIKSAPHLVDLPTCTSGGATKYSTNNLCQETIFFLSRFFRDTNVSVLCCVAYTSARYCEATIREGERRVRDSPGTSGFSMILALDISSALGGNCMLEQ